MESLRSFVSHVLAIQPAIHMTNLQAGKLTSLGTALVLVAEFSNGQNEFQAPRFLPPLFFCIHISQIPGYTVFIFCQLAMEDKYRYA